MNSERFELVEQLFREARGLGLEEREGFLHRHAAHSDPAVIREVRSLLAADASPVTIFETRALGGCIDASGVALASEIAGMPERIGPYRIVGYLGEGGMGVVFEAEQENPRRRVALKVIRSGAAGVQAAKRFELEGQLLGRLQHPGIAQIYEAGTAEIGAARWPFFAMELVRGPSLTRYVLEHKPDLSVKLELMARICDAVHHAHMQGVIHRDLKPGNILVAGPPESGPEGTTNLASRSGVLNTRSAGVTRSSAQPTPKVLDFGVARLAGPDLRATMLRTDAGQLIGTLPYMSPEQIDGDPTSLDTRSDVYALGVILYELLTGRLPYELGDVPVVAAARIVREQEPTRLGRTSKAFRGDLETIVGKALEKDRARRYQSAEQLGDDIRGYLTDQPIRARPASTLYHFRKFARRNRAIVIGVGAAMLALVAGTAGTAWQAIRATHQRDAATSAETVAEREKDRATAEAETSRRITEFFQDLLASADPETARGKEITVRELVDRASAGIADSLKDQPMVEAGVRATLGKIYAGLGDYPKAQTHLQEALRLRQEKLGPDAPETLEVRSGIATIHWMQGDLDKAAQECSAVLEGTERHFGPDSVEYFQALDELATVLSARGQTDEAIGMCRRVLEGYRRLLGSEDSRTVIVQNNLAFKLDSCGRSAEAEPLFRDSTATTRKLLGSDHPDTVTCIATLANCLRVLGKLDEAEELAREALETRRRIYPPGHPLTGDVCELIGRILCKRGDGAGAVPYLTEGLENHRRSLPEGSWRTAVTGAWLGVAFTKCGRYDEAEKLLLEGHETLQRTKGQHAGQEVGVISSLVDLYEAWGKPDKAAEFQALLEH